MKIKEFAAFAGIGAYTKALKNIGVEVEVVGYSEIDEYASKAFSAIHGVSEDINYGDITKIDPTILPDFDIFTYGFPCQSFSVAGKQLGIDDPRGVLFFDAMRIIREKKPKYAVAENVKGLVGKKFKDVFEHMLKELEHAGYNNYWKVLNAKDFGIPQNRERVFIVSIRKDIDKGYEFPEGFKSDIRLKDILEKEVGKKYYLSDKCVQGFLKHNENHFKKGTGFLWQPRDVDENASCLRANPSLAPTDNTIDEKSLDGFAIKKINEFIKKNGYLPKMFNPYNGTEVIDIAPTQITYCGSVTSSATVLVFQENEGILKVGDVPKEVLNDNENQRIVYSDEGCSPDVFTRTDSAKIMQVGNIVNTGNFENPQRGRIYSPNGISPALNTVGGGGLEPKILEEPVICALRGRNPENTSDRRAGIKLKQTLEINDSGLSNTLTTVQKDNYVLEPNSIIKYDAPQTERVRKYEVDVPKLKILLKNAKNESGLTNKNIAELLEKPVTLVKHWFRSDECFSIPDKDVWFKLKDILNIRTNEFDSFITEFPEREGGLENSNRFYDSNGITPTLTTVNNEKIIEPQFRIRKLTPLECWRLMGFDDDDYWKVRRALEEAFYKGKDKSNSQMYKMAGNSIVVNVLQAIFRELFKVV